MTERPWAAGSGADGARRASASGSNGGMAGLPLGRSAPNEWSADNDPATFAAKLPEVVPPPHCPPAVPRMARRGLE